MRFIFIALFLVSFGSVSMGGVGDVYYCEIIKYDNFFLNKDGNHTSVDWPVKTFMFKWRNGSIISGEKGYQFGPLEIKNEN